MSASVSLAHFHGNSVKKEIHGHEGPTSGFEGQNTRASMGSVSQEERTDWGRGFSTGAAHLEVAGQI